MSNVATGTVSIACTNAAPVAVNQSLTINEDYTGSIDFLSGASDTDAGDTIVFSGLLVSPSNGTITSTGLYIPNANFCGTDSFSFQLSDTFGPVGSNVVTGTVSVTCVNDTPLAVNDTASTSRNTTIAIDVLANDSDNDLATILGGII